MVAVDPTGKGNNLQAIFSYHRTVFFRTTPPSLPHKIENRSQDSTVTFKNYYKIINQKKSAKFLTIIQHIKYLWHSICTIVGTKLFFRKNLFIEWPFTV